MSKLPGLVEHGLVVSLAPDKRQVENQEQTLATTNGLSEVTNLGSPAMLSQSMA